MKILSRVVLIVCIFSWQNLIAQSLSDIPNVYIESEPIADVEIDDYVSNLECYDIELTPSPLHPNATIGHPNLSDSEYQDTRENMTVTLKINHAGINMGIHANDEIWVFDEEGRLVEHNVAYDDPFHPGEHLFFLNIRGNFDFYKASIIYYNAQYNCTIQYDDIIDYHHNRVLGSPLEPFVIDTAPIQFSLNGTTLSAELVDANYNGDYCVTVDIIDCEGHQIGSDEICYLVGTAPCPDNLVITQEMLQLEMNQAFYSRITIESNAQVAQNQDILFSAGECTTLLPGFEVSLGSQLLVETEGCP